VETAIILIMVILVAWDGRLSAAEDAEENAGAMLLAFRLRETNLVDMSSPCNGR